MIRLMYFLLDLLKHQSLVNKKFEKNDVFIWDVPIIRTDFVKILNQMKKGPLADGWESKFIENFKGIKFYFCKFHIFFWLLFSNIKVRSRS